SWQISMLAFTLPTLIAALAMWRFLPETNSKLKTRQGEAHPRPGDFLRQTLRDMWLHLHNRRLGGAFIIGFTLFFGFIGTFTYLPYYLTGPHFRLSTISLGLVYLLWLTGVLSPVAGSIAERIGSRRAIAFTMGLAACGLLTTLIPSLPVVIVGLGMLAVGMFCTVPAVNLYLGEQAATARGTAASMYLSLYYFGGSFGAVLPGITFLWAGWLGVVFLCLGMVLIALASDAILC
ncbi:MAG: MFS transporter, partial [Ktedonobacteraceae bacterium]